MLRSAAGPLTCSCPGAFSVPGAAAGQIGNSFTMGVGSGDTAGAASAVASPEHTSSVSESLMWHTLHTCDVSCGALYTSRRSPALSRTRIARTTLLA